MRTVSTVAMGRVKQDRYRSRICPPPRESQEKPEDEYLQDSIPIILEMHDRPQSGSGATFASIPNSA